MNPLIFILASFAFVFGARNERGRLTEGLQRYFYKRMCYCIGEDYGVCTKLKCCDVYDHVPYKIVIKMCRYRDCKFEEGILSPDYIVDKTNNKGKEEIIDDFDNTEDINESKEEEKENEDTIYESANEESEINEEERPKNEEEKNDKKKENEDDQGDDEGNDKGNGKGNNKESENEKGNSNKNKEKEETKAEAEKEGVPSVPDLQPSLKPPNESEEETTRKVSEVYMSNYL